MINEFEIPTRKSNSNLLILPVLIMNSLLLFGDKPQMTDKWPTVGGMDALWLGRKGVFFSGAVLHC